MPWPGLPFWAYGTSASRGVAVLVRDGIGWDDPPPTSVEIDALDISHMHEPAGRILRIDFSWCELLFSVVSVYAPSTSEHRQPFFAQQLLPYIPQGRHLIVAGDFNCVADDLDVTPNAHGTRRTGYTGGLATVMHTFGLNDAWREQHPAASAVTHVCASSRTGARLDRFLVSTDVLLHTTHTDILEGLPGDHLGVSLRIVAPQGIQQGPRPWIFPPELIDDDIYSKELSDLIRHFLLDHPLTISFDHRARWDALKAEIRDHCSEFLRRSALRLNAMHRSLTERARTARVAFVLCSQDPTRYDILQEAPRDLST